MSRKTIAQLREMEVDKLAHYASPEPTEQDYATARRLMNSYYRLCGLANTNLYLSNEEWSCNLPSTAKSEQRESDWSDRLSKELQDFCGLQLVYFSWLPSIGIVVEHGGAERKINAWFYD